jgi:hypothetical protein
MLHNKVRGVVALVAGLLLASVDAGFATGHQAKRRAGEDRHQQRRYDHAGMQRSSEDAARRQTALVTLDTTSDGT